MKYYIWMIVIAVMSISVLADSSQVGINLVNQDPDPANSGDVVELRIGIENRGEDVVNDLIVELVPEYPFEAVPGENMAKSIPTLGTFQYNDDVQIVKFKIRINRDAIAGAYPLKVNYHADGESNLKKQSTLSIDIETHKNAEVIFIDKYEIVPGQITPLTFTINNVGSSPLRDLTFHWENAEGAILPVGSDDTRYIKYIDVGQKEELVYSVIASTTAEPNLYKLSLTLSYDDPVTHEEQTIETAAGVYVGGQTDFDVAYSGSSQGELSFSISNIGSVSASSVTVSIPRQPNWQVTGSNSEIIGNLDKGDYTIASFTMQSSNQNGQNAQTAPSPSAANQNGPRMGNRNMSGAMLNSSRANNQVQVQIAYTDTRGIRHTVNKDVMVDTSSAKSQGAMQGGAQGRMAGSTAKSKTKWYMFGAVIIIALWFLHKTYKKRKFDDPKYTYGKLIKNLNPFK